MIDAYEVGQKLTAEDFIDPFYFPPKKWEYAEVEEITDDTVTLHYYDFNDPQGELVKTYTRADMEEMLGWDLSADELTIDIEDSASESDVNVNEVLDAPTEEKVGSYELLASNPPAYIRVSNGVVHYMRVFGDRAECEREFHANARR